MATLTPLFRKVEFQTWIPGTHWSSQSDDLGGQSQQWQPDCCMAGYGPCLWVNCPCPHSCSLKPLPHPLAHQGNDHQLLWQNPVTIQDSPFSNLVAKPGKGYCEWLQNLPHPLRYGNEPFNNSCGEKKNPRSKNGVRLPTTPNKRLHGQPNHISRNLCGCEVVC